ncbi:MAG: multiple sugar transport system permease protein, partial [Gaiellaceae bacterium]|nr:multiple sugar transport system permease protein [Gaiellaceae bacterium]
MSPWLAGFTIFFGYPLVMSVYLSFTHYNLLSPAKWVGLGNYRYLLHTDPQVGVAIKNSLWFIAIAVPLQVLFAFGIALMLARARRGLGFFRTIFYLPALAPPVAATLGFVYLLNPATGPINTLLAHVGVNGPLWFQSPNWSKPSLTLLSIWGVGNTMIIFLAAILDVPKHLYESAELDGAGRWQSFSRVTIPMIRPTVLFSVVTSTIGGLQIFTEPLLFTSPTGGSQGQGLTMTLFLYGQAVNSFKFGYACAIAV